MKFTLQSSSAKCNGDHWIPPRDYIGAGAKTKVDFLSRQPCQFKVGDKVFFLQFVLRLADPIIYVVTQGDEII